MKLGEVIEDFKNPPHPRGISLEGEFVSLEPLCSSQHGPELFQSFICDRANEIWTYLYDGPFDNESDFTIWLQTLENNDDPVFFTIVRKSDETPLGIASYLRINQESGSIEVGNLVFSSLLQRTTHATESMYLMMKWVFENGFRRYEWKCHALNKKSRRAAQRLGFSFEGVFRQMTISKGRNRDTAWFAIIDKEWQALRNCYDQYLSPKNFDENNHPIISLTSMTKKLLYKSDDFELS